MRALVVEDDPELGELIKSFLGTFQYERVRLCKTGTEACQVVQREHFDCAIVDLLLPDMNGIQFLSRLRQEDPTTSVIMMSGYPTMEYAIESMRAGASDFLAKPFDFQHLMLAMERVARERKLLLENISLQVEQQALIDVERLNRELRERMAEQARLFEISREIEAVRSSGELYSLIVSLASRMAAADKAALFILSNDPKNMLLISECGFKPDEVEQRVFSIESEEIKEILAQDGVWITPRKKERREGSFLQSIASGDGPLSVWPLRIRNELFGFLVLYHNGAKAPSEDKRRLLEFLVRKSTLAIENMALYENVMSNFYGTLKSLVNALEARDAYTGKHSERVTGYAVAIARQLNCSTVQIESLQHIGYLHDIGKIGIADSILNKPGPLTQQEWMVIKQHPVIGENIVTELVLSPEERSIIRHHHERWDGKGYPDGLAEEEIPLTARIVAVADAFDSMTSKRAYRDPMPKEAAFKELVTHAGKQFDPVAVKAFIKAWKDEELFHRSSMLSAGSRLFFPVQR